MLNAKFNFVDAAIEAKDIFQYLDQIELYKFYGVSVDKIGTPFLSPLRQETTPSFSLRYYDNRLKFKDFGTGESGDIINFVQLKYKLNFIEAINKIANDFKIKEIRLRARDKSINIDSKDSSTNINSILQNNEQKKRSNNTIIEITIKQYGESDINYWTDYGVDLNLLYFYNVYCCQYVWLNGKIKFAYTKSNPIFAFKFNDKFKIYKPLAKEGKWISNVARGDIIGYKQLDTKENILIITKSLKDVMVIRTLGINSISFQSETNDPKYYEYLIEELKQRFDKIIVWYDPDKAGYQGSQRFADYFNLERVFMYDTLCLLKGNIDLPKDIADYRKKEGYLKTRELVLDKINL